MQGQFQVLVDKGQIVLYIECMSKGKDKVIPIFFAVDDGYVKFWHVAIKSLMAGANKDYKYNIHLLCCGLDKKNVASIMALKDENFSFFVNDVTAKAKSRAKLMERGYHGDNNKAGCATYYRAFIPAMFPEYDKAMYLDSDICLNGDVAELFNMDMKDNLITAAPDGPVSSIPVFQEYVVKFIGVKKPENYVNAGILVMNTEALRDMDFEERFFDVLAKFKLEVDHDQGVLNYLCRDRINYVPENWNKMVVTGETIPLEKVRIVHYNLTAKPWITDDVAYASLFWKFAEGTPFYDEILKCKSKVTEKDLEGAQVNLGRMIATCEELIKGKSLHERLIDATFGVGGGCGGCCGCCRKNCGV